MENVQQKPSWFSNPGRRAFTAQMPFSFAKQFSTPLPQQGKTGSHNRAEYLTLSFKMKNSSIILNMQNCGKKLISSSRLYIYFYKICYYRLDHFGRQKKPGSEF